MQYNYLFLIRVPGIKPTPPPPIFVIPAVDCRTFTISLQHHSCLLIDGSACCLRASRPSSRHLDCFNSQKYHAQTSDNVKDLRSVCLYFSLKRFLFGDFKVLAGIVEV